MDAERVVSSNQEQAVAAWVGYLNQVRIDRMLAEFAQQDLDLERAVAEMAEAVRGIDDLILKNDGGARGLHGKIAEVAEVGVRNARNLVRGREITYSLPDTNNGPVDVWRGAQGLQLKFYQSGGDFSLSAVRKHLETYSWFLKEGNKYVIPRDQYNSVMKLSQMTEREASRLVGSDNGLSYRQWKLVQAFFKETGVTPDDLEPAAFDYADVQKATIHTSMEEESESLRDVHDARHDASYEKSKPTLHEGAKATVAAAAIEGGAAFAMALAAKVREGKRIRNLGQDDWADIAGASGKGFAKGGVRGAGVYFLTNHTATSAAVASSLVTASFGVAEQAHLLRKGGISEEEFLANSEMLCLDSAVSAVSSFVGQAVIPVPVLGAVIGNTVGNVLYQIAKDGLSEREQALVAAYAKAQNSLDAKLDARYQALISKLETGMHDYLVLLDRALAPDPVVAFDGSVALTKALGVPDDDILKTIDEIDNFFLA